MDDNSQSTVELCRSPYSAALNSDKNIINEAKRFEATENLYQELWNERDAIIALTKHHLGLQQQDDCLVSPREQWIRGSFNVCLPIEVRRQGTRQKLMLRCALPHQVAETINPGSMDEKLTCEAGTYVYMQEKCSDIRIPHLYGFGFSDQRYFTHQSHRPLFSCIFYYIRRLLNRIFNNKSLLSRYIYHPSSYRLPTTYMLLEDIRSTDSQMLSNTWQKQRGDPDRRRRLFCGISRLIISLARIPQARIGSFCFQDDGVVTLTNRPLTSSMMILENDSTPKTIPSKTTYNSAEPFIEDLFEFRDQRFLSHPNAICSIRDCRSEMATSVLSRAIAHHYVKRNQRSGPFILQFDDLHASNIFVDNEWNITCLIDLEWICALPVGKLAVPYWLSGGAIDEIQEERKSEFDRIQNEFCCILEEEENKFDHRLGLASLMRDAYKTKAMWFWYGLMSTNAMWSLLIEHLLPAYRSTLHAKDDELLSSFWSQDSNSVVERKVGEYREYESRLKQLYRKGATEASKHI